MRRHDGVTVAVMRWAVQNAVAGSRRATAAVLDFSVSMAASGEKERRGRLHGVWLPGWEEIRCSGSRCGSCGGRVSRAGGGGRVAHHPRDVN